MLWFIDDLTKQNANEMARFFEDVTKHAIQYKDNAGGTSTRSEARLGQIRPRPGTSATEVVAVTPPGELLKIQLLRPIVGGGTRLRIPSA